jgi:hypothetical protein
MCMRVLSRRAMLLCERNGCLFCAERKNKKVHGVDLFFSFDIATATNVLFKRIQKESPRGRTIEESDGVLEDLIIVACRYLS